MFGGCFKAGKVDSERIREKLAFRMIILITVILALIVEVLEFSGYL